MDRNLRLTTNHSASRRSWIRAGALGLAVAGFGLALGAGTPQPAFAQVSGTSMSVPLAADAPDRYVVKRGDTLWDIAGVFLRDPWYWPEIWYVNPSISNPHLIFPGDVLNLVYVDGKPRLTLERGETVRLSPQMHSELLSSAIRAIPYDLLMDFVRRPQLLDRETARRQPHVVGMRNRHIIGSDQNEIYARGLGEVPVGSRYTIINVGNELRDPDDGDLLGYMGHFAGTGQVLDTSTTGRRDEPITHLRVIESGREILQGDRLFPAEVDVGADFVPSAPSNKDINGRVVAVVGGVYVAGRYQVLAVNRGTRDGLVPGNVLAIFDQGETIADRASASFWRRNASNYENVRLPKERSASVLLFSVHERMSYGLVVDSTQVIRIGDYLKHPAFGHRDTGQSDFIPR
ncbi:MAG: LysM protein [Pseudomonadota bacterium]|nr:LysM protein [Pseudomonadota bacterium]